MKGHWFAMRFVVLTFILIISGCQVLEAIILGDGGKKHQVIVQLLIDHRADVNLSDSDGMSPLQHARSNGYQDMIEMLTIQGGK